MALKKPVVPGKKYQVTLSASATNSGPAMLAVMWIPRAGAHVPHPEDAVVAPAASATVDGTVPTFEAARRMEVRVHFEDGKGNGELTVKMNGAVHTSAAITADTTWVSIVE